MLHGLAFRETVEAFSRCLHSVLYSREENLALRSSLNLESAPESGKLRFGAYSKAVGFSVIVLQDFIIL